LSWIGYHYAPVNRAPGLSLTIESCVVGMAYGR
jgi:hypothetical protein